MSMDAISGLFYKATKKMPNEIRRTQKGNLYVKVIRETADDLHTQPIYEKLATSGLTLVRDRNQLAQCSILCRGVPADANKWDKEQLMDFHMRENPGIKVLDLYLMPGMNRRSSSLTMKLTLGTKDMAATIKDRGLLTIGGVCIHPLQIERCQYLKEPQCGKCHKLGHRFNLCPNEVACPHCGEGHTLPNCPAKQGKPKCSNCGEEHRATSNACQRRKDHLIRPGKQRTKRQRGEAEAAQQQRTVYAPAPPPAVNAWTQRGMARAAAAAQPPAAVPVAPAVAAVPVTPAVAATPVMTHSEALRMAAFFEDWHYAFLELQKAFHLPVFEIPQSIRGSFRKDVTGLPLKEALPPPPPPKQQRAQTSTSARLAQSQPLPVIDVSQRVRELEQRSQPSSPEDHNLSRSSRGHVESVVRRTPTPEKTDDEGGAFRTPEKTSEGRSSVLSPRQILSLSRLTSALGRDAAASEARRTLISPSGPCENTRTRKPETTRPVSKEATSGMAKPTKEGARGMSKPPGREDSRGTAKTLSAKDGSKLPK